MAEHELTRIIEPESSKGDLSEEVKKRVKKLLSCLGGQSKTKDGVRIAQKSKNSRALTTVKEN